MHLCPGDAPTDHSKSLATAASRSTRTALTAQEDAFTQAFRHHSAELYQRCLGWMGGSESEADEAFSQASLRIFRKFSTYASQVGNLRAWMLRLTHNVCMDQHRLRRRRREEMLDSAIGPETTPGPLLPGSGARDPERSYLGKELQQFLAKAIRTLPPRLRTTMLHQLVLGDYQRVAEELAITEVNVRKRMQEARAALRHHLASYRDGADASGIGSPLRSRPSKQSQSQHPRLDHPPANPLRTIHTVRVTIDGESESETTLHLPYRPPELTAKKQRSLERYIKEHPSGWTRRRALGRSLLVSGQARQSIPHFDHVVKRQPRQLDSWLDLALPYRLLEAVEAEAAVYERALASVPHEPSRTYLQGCHARTLGNLEQAENCFVLAAKQAPRQAVPQVALAEVRKDAGLVCEALASLDAARAADPRDLAALTAMPHLYRFAGHSRQAVEQLSSARDLDNSNPSLLGPWLVTRLRANGGATQPESPETQCWRSLTERSEPTASLYANLALAEALTGESRGIGRRISQLLALAPKLRQSWLACAHYLDWRGRPQQAVLMLDKARSLGASGRDLALTACRLFVRAGERWRLAREIERIQRLYNEDWETLATIAWAIGSANLAPHRVLEFSAQAVERQPELPAAWIEHGQRFASQGRAEQAILALKQARELLPDQDGFELAAVAALEIARIERRRGRGEACHRWAHKAMAAAGALQTLDRVEQRLLEREIQPLTAAGAGHTKETAENGFDLIETSWRSRAQLAERLRRRSAP